MTSSTAHFLSTIYGQVSGLRHASEQFSEQLAPGFNVFRLLWPSELTLSNVLADLLSPQGSHGQKAAFLALFLKTFGLADSWAIPSEARVATEVATHGGRRIDIRIDFADGVLGIENKPWAADQKLQVADYIAELEAKHPQNRLLIYLSSNGDGPGEDSTGKARDFVKEGSLRVIGYGQLLAWLASCKGVCRSLRVIAFLDEFSDYIAKEFEGVMQMHERDMVVSEVVKNSANVEAAFLISGALNDVKAKLLAMLWAQLREKFLQSYPAWQMEIDFSRPENSKWQGIRISVTPGCHYLLRLQFAQGNCNECVIGIAKAKGDDKLSDRPRVTEALLEAFAVGQSEEPDWPWWRNFDPGRWGDNAEVWSSVLSGALSQKIFSEFQEIYVALETRGLLAELN